MDWRLGALKSLRGRLDGVKIVLDPGLGRLGLATKVEGAQVR